MAVHEIILLNQNTAVNIPSGLHPMGAYDNGVDYAVGDSVDYQGSSYVQFLNAPANTVPTNTTYWQVLANKGATGADSIVPGPAGNDGTNGADGQGVPTGGTTNQVLAKNSDSNYDTKWANAGSGSGDVVGPATNTDNYIPQWNGANSKTLKDGLAVPAGGLAGLTALGGKQDALGFTAEDVSKRRSTFQVTPDDTHYPTEKLVKDSLDAKQASGSYLVASDITGKEDSSNKSTNVTTDGASDTKYPSVKSVKTYVDNAVVGLLDYRGSYDASTNLYPATGGSGIAGAILKGDFWIISVTGTLGGKTMHLGDYVIAINDTPAQTDANWDTIDTNPGYTPENAANKVTSISGASTDTQYPSAKLLYDQLAGKQASGTYLTSANIEDSIVDAHTTIAPSGNAVFDALALKAPLASPTFTTLVTLPKTVLGEASFQLDPAISADGAWSGITETGTAGATLTFGQLCYYNSSNKWVLAKADSATTSTNKLGICILAAAGDNSATEILLFGKVNAAAQFPTLTVGAPVYISAATGGAVVTAQPSATDNVIRIIGFANSADELYFTPDNMWISHV